MLVRMSLLSLTVLTIGFFVDAGSAADKEPPPSDKQRREDIDKLIKQLSAEDFKSREEATRQLMKRDDAWPALRVAAKSDDAEVRRRAQSALEVIDKRLGKHAIERAIAKLKKGQTDQFVDQVVTWRQYMNEEGWKAALEHAQTIADKAGKLNGRKYKVLPRIDVAKLKFSHGDQLTIPNTFIFQKQCVVAEDMKIPDNITRDDFLLCRGLVELDKRNALAWSVVFLNGDLNVGDPTHYGNIDETFVVCDGNVTVTGSIYDSVVLAAGNVRVGISVENSVVVSGGEVKAGADLVPGVNNNGVAVEKSLIQRHQRNPLNFIHFFDLAEQGIEVKVSRQQVIVEGVAAGKCFAQAGVRKGDCIVSVDGAKVASVEGLRRLLRRRMLDSNAVRLEIRREDRLLPVEVRLGEKSP